MLDVSYPTAPKLIGSYPIRCDDVMVVGTTAYVTGGPLVVLDVSDPTSPTFLGSYAAPDSTMGVTVVDSTAYVANALTGLLILNVGPCLCYADGDLSTGAGVLEICRFLWWRND